jgi:hypothetical protein
MATSKNHKKLLERSQARLLDQLRNKLCQVHSAPLEPAKYLLSVLTPDILTSFVEHAYIITPKNITFHIDRPFMCHSNAWRYAMDQLQNNPQYNGMPYLAFRLFEEDGIRWCLHSVVVEDQGRTVVDSGGYLPDGAPAVYVAVPWNLEIIEQMKWNAKSEAIRSE